MNTLVESQLRTVAIIGNPNSGKSSVFNALTGLRQKVANYPGVTVEKKEGIIHLENGDELTILDLPGTYSLLASSPDEKIAVDVFFGVMHETPVPDLIICVVDASNLERNLYLVSQIIDFHIPLVIALNMVDVAEREGISIDIKKLSSELGVKIVSTIANRGVGIDELKKAIVQQDGVSSKPRQWTLSKVLRDECDELTMMLRQKHEFNEPRAFHEAMTLLTSPERLNEHVDRYDPEIIAHVRRDHEKLKFLGIDCQSEFVESRYGWINTVCDKSVTSSNHSGTNLSDRFDHVLTHKVWGFVVFLGLMTFMFQAIFAWANIPMEMISESFDWLGGQVALVIPAGDLQDLLINGALAGVGAVVTFLPQILFLFLFLGILEDTGYMARAAFIMDRVMSKVGLHGKSFIPLLSSFACAIPGIMATRTIESPKDRLVTMLVAPLIGCSARLPIYTLLIAAFIPPNTVLGFFSLAGMTMVGLYLLGLSSAMIMAFIFKRTLLKGEIPAFIMELPPYKLPSLRSMLIQIRERALLFLKSAGTFILGVSIVLWFLASYPKVENSTSAEQLEQSFAGRAGHLIEPLIRPLGFDWKIGIGLIGSILQREVFVSTMGTIYNIKDADQGDGNVSLRQHLQSDIDPATGKPTFTMLTAICLMVYYALAMQCMSTVAVMRRETNGWRWPLFQIGYMTLLAYSATFIVYRIGLVFQG